MIRRLLPLAGIIIAIWSTAARAEPSGLNLHGTITATSETCWTTTINHLDLTWGGGPIGDCPADGVTLTLTGAVWSPGPNTTWFAASDDGLRITIDGTTVIDYWYDRPCWGNWFYPNLDAGWHTITIDYYENGGGTCLYLGRDDGDEFRWLTTQDLQQATPTSTTTEPETTSTESTTTSTTPPTSTTEAPTTTTTEPAPEPATSTSTSTSTSSTAAPTTSAPPVTDPPVTYQDSTTIATNSTTSSAPSPSSTGSASTAPSITQPTAAPTTASTQASTTIPSPTTASPVTSTTTLALVPESTTTTVPTAPRSSAEALAAALTGNIDDTNAEKLFAAIDENTLTPEQGAALVAIIQDASPTIRAAFENNINIFAGATDTYIPLGSRVPVSTRRVIIITSGLLVAMPTARRKP